MKRSRFTEEQIGGVGGWSFGCRAVPYIGMGDASFYKWKARYGGLEVSEARRLKSLEDENTG
jgi:putative transposase